MPMDKSRYPRNWDEIALTVKLAANWTCQECGKPCRRVAEAWFDFFEREGWEYAEDPRWVRYVLTVAHLDQNPSNNDPDNLKALCSVCHLRHDAPFRKANSLAKRERQGQLNCFDLTAPELAGHGHDHSRIQAPIRMEVEP